MPCKTVVLTKDCLMLDTMLYRQMIGRAGRRGFDTIGNVVYFGVPENKVKSFISSDLIKLKSSKISYDLTTILQLSMLNFSNNENMKFVDTFVKYPFSQLCNDTVIANNEIARLQILYLIEQNYLTKDFKPKKLSRLVLPLRLEECNVFLISEMLQNKLFSKILDGKNNSTPIGFEENCRKLIISLCYFTDPLFINPSLINSTQKDIILPNIPDIDNFIDSHNSKLDSLFNWAFTNDDISSDALKEKKAYFKRTFPYYQNLPKNSYIYNFYVDGSLDRIENLNNKSVTSLWYSLKTMRILLETLLNYVDTFEPNKVLKIVLEACNEKIKKRFESIMN